VYCGKVKSWIADNGTMLGLMHICGEQKSRMMPSPVTITLTSSTNGRHCKDELLRKPTKRNSSWDLKSTRGTTVRLLPSSKTVSS